jgi:sialic acid synthase SpsE
MTYVIAEIGLNHNGDISKALKLIEIAASSGCDAVKFQKRDIPSLAISEVLDSEDLRFPDFGTTYREVREHHEFNFDQYIELKRCSKKFNLDFIVTPFDIKSVDFLINLGVDKFKIASHSLTNIPLLNYISNFNIPVIMSTGMSKIKEVDYAVDLFIKANINLELMHCISAYPTPPELANLSLIKFYKDRYGLNVGYSGHEMGFLQTLIAVSLGATSIERHITLSINEIGFDHKLSLEPEELEKMVKTIREVELSFGVDHRDINSIESITRSKYHVSAVSSRNIRKGEILDWSMLEFKNPGIGLSYFETELLIGKSINRDIPKDVLLEFDDLV